MKRLTNSSRRDLARAIIAEAKALGSTVSLEGAFVVFRPPLPMDLLLRANGLSEELADEVRAECFP